jgi:hypothetical protein
VVGSNTFTTTSIRCTARCLAIGSQDPRIPKGLTPGDEVVSGQIERHLVWVLRAGGLALIDQ